MGRNMSQDTLLGMICGRNQWKSGFQILNFNMGQRRGSMVASD